MSNQTCECPFCGRQLQITKQDDDYNVAVVCNAGSGGCGARGPYQRTADEAISAWNTRTQLRTAAAEGGEAVAWQCEWMCPYSNEIARVTFEHKRGADSRAEEVGLMLGVEARVDPLYLHPPTDSGAGRDGERYRWLRDHGAGALQVYAGVRELSLLPEELDAAIDTAIAGAAGERD